MVVSRLNPIIITHRNFFYFFFSIAFVRAKSYCSAQNCPYVPGARFNHFRFQLVRKIECGYSIIHIRCRLYKSRSFFGLEGFRFQVYVCRQSPTYFRFRLVRYQSCYRQVITSELPRKPVICGRELLRNNTNTADNNIYIKKKKQKY